MASVSFATAKIQLTRKGTTALNLDIATSATVPVSPLRSMPEPCIAGNDGNHAARSIVSTITR
jgi:hypothetical protein